ncbi:putative PurR-regulated permease PerM [Paenibacillus phyllosphaerae]|uniref:Putative PurR-regulated permease PerM n=1 Tax=Paenibacillus phyllosphaerae TaxID=274593 RepID=A0A7W5FQL5_9BACL|nr:putative PurR-regulated permease PerM [Paenibacillus phyllosphaerae]
MIVLPKSKFFRVGYGILLIFLIIWVGVHIKFVFHPIVVMCQTLFIPLLISGVLYYLLRPLVQFLVSRKIPRSAAILILYLLVICLFTLLIIYVAPMIQRQFVELGNNLPNYVRNAVEKVYELTDNESVNQFLTSFSLDFNTLQTKATDYAYVVVNWISTNITAVVSFVANVVLLAVVVPFVLYYFLKDGEKMSAGVIKVIPKKNQTLARKLLTEMDQTISTYIRGQITVAVCVGVLLLIGYFIIGIEYAVLLALAAMLTNVIPYVGAFISAVPAVLVAAVDSPMMVVKVLIVTLVAQQIEGNLISPQIMGKQLEIHPLTIILLLLVAGTLVGPLGLLLAVPFYAIAKIIVVQIYRFIKLRTEPDIVPPDPPLTE